MIALSVLASWSLFGLLLFGFLMWCVLMAASDADDYWEADERSWLSDDEIEHRDPPTIPAGRYRSHADWHNDVLRDGNDPHEGTRGNNREERGQV